MPTRIVLHRPRSSQNIGAAARAIANTSAGELVVVEPEGFDRAQAARLAAGADAVLERMTVARSLDEALAGCTDVIMTTGKPSQDLPPPLEPRAAAERLAAAPGLTALVFGDEVRGLTNRQLSRAAATTTIPTTEKSSLNLAQAVIVYGYELMLARRTVPPAPPPPAPLAEEQLLTRLRDRARALLLSAGFLNPQQPDAVLDELCRLLRRAQPSQREAQLLLSAVDQLGRAT